MTIPIPTNKLLKTQYDFLTCDAEVACWIAGVGAGKTRTGGVFVLDECMKYDNNLGIVAAATGPQLAMSTIPKCLEVFDDHNVHYSWTEYKKMTKFSNDSWYKYQSLDVPAVELKGSELGFLLVDEVDACSEAHILNLMQRVRKKGTSRKIRFIGNSPPPGHWVEDWFVNKPNPKWELFQSDTYENLFLPNDYIARLEWMYPPGTSSHARFMLGGIGVAVEGAIYPEWKPSFHIVEKIPETAKIIGRLYGLDLGFNHPTVFLSAVLTDDDVIYIVDEYCASRKSMEEHAERINDMYERGPIFSDHDAQDRHELRLLGLSTLPAMKDHDQGFYMVRSRLRDGRVKVLSHCKKLIMEMPNYHYVEGKEVPYKREDDAVDALRYLITGLDAISHKRQDVAAELFLAGDFLKDN